MESKEKKGKRKSKEIKKENKMKNYIKNKFVESKMKVLILISVLFIALTVGVVSADKNCPPSGPPKVFEGNIFYNDSLLVGNYNLIASIGKYKVGEVEVNGGRYNNLQVSPCSGVIGEIIFVVNGVESVEKSVWSNSQDEDWGKKVNLNLNVQSLPPIESPCGNGEINKGEECDDGNTLGGDGCSASCEVELGYSCYYDGERSVCTFGPSCGDGVCNNGETCSTCPRDCGACSGGSSGGSSRSSSSSGGSGSLISQNTVLANSSVEENTEEIQEENEIIEVETEPEEKKGFFNWITGRTIGGEGNESGKMVIILTSILLIGAYFVYRARIKE